MKKLVKPREDRSSINLLAQNGIENRNSCECVEDEIACYSDYDSCPIDFVKCKWDQCDVDGICRPFLPDDPIF